MIIIFRVILQRLLPMLEGGSDLFTQGAPQVPTSSVYTIRPFISSDKVRALSVVSFTICQKSLSGNVKFNMQYKM